MLRETLIDLGVACVVFTVRVPDGTGLVFAGWPTPAGPDWVALPIIDDTIPPDILLTQAGHVQVGLLDHWCTTWRRGRRGAGKCHRRARPTCPPRGASRAAALR